MASNFIIIVLSITSAILPSSICQSEYRKLNEFDHLSSEMYHIDKTDLLRIFFKNSSTSDPNTTFCYITCPRGFGKTTNLKMIQSFAQIELDSRGNIKPISNTQANYIFKKLKIYNHKEIVAQHMGRYPVLYLNLAGFARTSRNIDQIRLEIMDLLSNSLEPYRLFKNDAKLYSKVENFTCLRFTQTKMQFIESLLGKNLTSEDLRRSLLMMSRSLYKYFNRTKIIIAIDDFDDTAIKSPLIKSSYVTQAYRELISILNEVFNNGASFVRNVIITGISSLPNSIDDFAKGNLTHYAFLDDHIFTPYFGLTEPDMRDFSTVYGITSEEQKAIIGYYNAYWTITNQTKLFSTNSITRYIINRSYTQKRPFPLKIYWILDDIQGSISRFLRHPEFRQLALDALKSGRLEYPIPKRQPSNAIQILEQFRDTDYRNESRTLTEILLKYYFEIGFLSYTSCQNVYTIPNLEIRKILKKEARIYVADHTA